MLGHCKAKVVQNSMDVFYERLLAQNKLFLEVKFGHGNLFDQGFCDFVSFNQQKPCTSCTSIFNTFVRENGSSL